MALSYGTLFVGCTTGSAKALYRVCPRSELTIAGEDLRV
jgi:hypothetical protein